jgi:hypothetical protein
LVENSIVQAVNLFIIIRNLGAFYNYNFEIGIRERQKAKGERRKAEGNKRTAGGGRRKETEYRV